MVKVENGQDETWQILVAVQIPISLSQAWLNTSTTARNRSLPKRSTPANKAGLDLSRKNGTMDQLETLIIFFFFTGQLCCQPTCRMQRPLHQRFCTTKDSQRYDWAISDMFSKACVYLKGQAFFTSKGQSQLSSKVRTQFKMLIR